MPRKNGRSRPQNTKTRIPIEPGPALGGVQHGSVTQPTNTQFVHRVETLAAKSSPIPRRRKLTNRPRASKASALSRYVQLVDSQGCLQLGTADGRRHIRFVHSSGSAGLHCRRARRGASGRLHDYTNMYSEQANRWRAFVTSSYSFAVNGPSSMSVVDRQANCLTL